MSSAKDILREAESLPIEERAILVDSLLRTMNQPDPGIDRKWAEVASRRLSELRSGKVQPVPGEVVFERIMKRLAE